MGRIYKPKFEAQCYVVPQTPPMPNMVAGCFTGYAPGNLGIKAGGPIGMVGPIGDPGVPGRIETFGINPVMAGWKYYHPEDPKVTTWVEPPSLLYIWVRVKIEGGEWDALSLTDTTSVTQRHHTADGKSIVICLIRGSHWTLNGPMRDHSKEPRVECAIDDKLFEDWFAITHKYM